MFKHSCENIYSGESGFSGGDPNPGYARMAIRYAVNQNYGFRENYRLFVLKRRLFSTNKDRDTVKVRFEDRSVW